MSGKKRYNTVISKDDYSIMLIKYKNLIIEVLIDNEDVEKVISVGSWHAIYDKTLAFPNYYICHRESGKPCLKLHRFVMNCPRDKEVDHINHNTLDNRKQNLEICTHFENQQNLTNKKTEQTGVFFRKRIQRNKLREFWVGNISKNKKKYSKEFKTKQDAINWRKYMESILYKEVV